MLSVAEAQTQALELVAPLPAETLAITDALGRVTAADVVAARDHPPFASAAMDGYAVRWADLDPLPATLRLIGVSQAGKGFAGTLTDGTCVRVLTGAPIPEGADTVVVQEDTSADGSLIHITDKPDRLGRHIRRRGLDATAGTVLLPAGTLITPAAQGWIAASAVTTLAVHRQPVVRLVAIGDELKAPGEPLGPDDIVSTNGLVLKGVLEADGARVTGWDQIVPDDPDALAAALADPEADLIVTIGGASVGDRDYVKPVLERLGARLAFWKIAMRPGKPLMMARLGAQVVIGLPGNPVSAFVCAQLFVRPMVRRLSGLATPRPAPLEGVWGTDQPANGPRADYVRATMARQAGAWVVTPAMVQDSSMLSVLAAADALAIRDVQAPAAKAGDPALFHPLKMLW
jgi:molybdopterin molybdotransferase